VNDWRIAALVGGLLIAGGGALMLSHVRAWKLDRNDPALDELDRQHYQARFRRRMQTSGLITLLGVLIPLGDSPVIWKLGPLWSTLFWIGVLLMALWIILLALGDFTATQAHSQVAMTRVRRKQRELEAEADRLRNKNMNGPTNQR
jgi:hypothetical protein